MTIKKETLQFLETLAENNNRDWFNDNKDKYVSANENFIQFVQTLIDEVAKFDKSVAGLDAKNSVFRIYRDIRFAKDKSPYKTHFGATLLGKENLCGNAGYYFHLQPGNSFLAGGVHMTEPKHLKAIRGEISRNGKAFLRIIGAKQFKSNFVIEGEQLAKIPKGLDKADPMGEYLKYKELMIRHEVDDKRILSKDFASYCSKVFKAMVPFNSFINKSTMAIK
ncbi:MAG: DUF2461 domain-containing protein [Candidatus Kryptoniota bacterium]